MGRRHIETTDGDIFDPKGTAPSSPVEGQVYYNSANHSLYFRSDTNWIDVAAGIPDASTTVSGQVNITTQTFGGYKTFNNGVHIYHPTLGNVDIGNSSVAALYAYAESASKVVAGVNVAAGSGVYGESAYGWGGEFAGATGVHAQGTGYGIQATASTGTGVKGTYTGTGMGGYGIYGEAVSTTYGAGIYGTSGYRGIWGNSTAVAIYGDGGTKGVYGTGSTYGIEGYSTNIAVYGSGGTNGVKGDGSTNGVYGTSPSGVAVRAETTTGNGVEGYAGISTTPGIGGVGVYGAGSTRGVQGQSTSGIGVYGSGSTHGVYASATTTGVYGTGTTNGIYGTSPSGVAVRAESLGGTPGNGVEGYAGVDPTNVDNQPGMGGVGVYGASSIRGVFGRAIYGSGVYGVGGDHGIEGNYNGAVTTGSGVYGHSAYGMGVRGHSDTWWGGVFTGTGGVKGDGGSTGYGVHGYSTGAFPGIKAENTYTYGIGLVAYGTTAVQGNGTSVGGAFEISSNNGTAMSATANVTGGVAVRAYSPHAGGSHAVLAQIISSSADAVHATAWSGNAIYGSSNTGYAISLTANATKSHIHLEPVSTLPTSAVDGDICYLTGYLNETYFDTLFLRAGDQWCSFNLTGR